ncbi:MAG TPA: hypothetical protein VNX28_09475 [Gemmataceae bacterium]|jgi:hypothetical protein|nr:hypothetical protein [Gemmataceae bacterium]
MSFVTNLFKDIFQSGNRSQTTGHHHGHHGHATYNQQSQLVPSTTSGASSANSGTSIQKLIQNLADEVGQALASTTK